MTILDTLLAVVVDEPGRERDALRTMLASMQNARIVEILDDCSALEYWMVGHYPDLVVIRERSIEMECLDRLKSIKKVNPQSRFLVIAEKMDQVQSLLAEGIDHVFLKGFTSTELFVVLDQWSMEKVMHYFTAEQKPCSKVGQSSFQELMI
jgi:response regulator RpfG family c-di-GMP phosphodiesterase